MIDLTLDVNILRSGNGTGEPRYFNPCRDLMSAMRDTTGVVLVLDRGKRILQKYDNHFKSDDWALRWLGEMAANNKIKIVDGRPLQKKTRLALSGAHFDWSDKLYVIVAGESDSRLLVTHDKSSFTARVEKVLKAHLGVAIISATDAGARL